MSISEGGDLICGKYEIRNDKNGKYLGTKNEDYSILTPLLQKRNRLAYEDISYANDSMAVVKKDNKWGIIKLDENNTPILPFTYDDISIFWDGDGIVKDSVGKMALYVNERIVTDFMYDDINLVSSTEEYLYKVQQRIEKNGEEFDMIGLIDKDGKTVLPAMYDYWDLYDGEGIQPINRNAFIIALDADNNSNEVIYGIVDSTGKTIMPFKYEKIQNRIEYRYSIGHPLSAAILTTLYPNWILIKENGLWCIIDIEKNKKIISGYAQINGYYKGNYIVAKYF